MGDGFANLRVVVDKDQVDPLSPPDGKEILNWLRGALRDFGVSDRHLLAYGVSEWSCAFRIGLYLARRVPSAWMVDSEYDRQGKHGDPKVRDCAGRTMRPDIVVHRRGSGALDDNLLFVEIKKLWRGDGDSDDLAKAEAAVSGRSPLGYQYQYGAVVGLCVGSVSERHFDPQWTVLQAGGMPIFSAQPVLDTHALGG